MPPRRSGCIVQPVDQGTRERLRLPTRAPPGTRRVTRAPWLHSDPGDDDRQLLEVAARRVCRCVVSSRPFRERRPECRMAAAVEHDCHEVSEGGRGLSRPLAIRPSGDGNAQSSRASRDEPKCSRFRLICLTGIGCEGCIRSTGLREVSRNVAISGFKWVFNASAREKVRKFRVKISHEPC